MMQKPEPRSTAVLLADPCDDYPLSSVFHSRRPEGLDRDYMER